MGGWKQVCRFHFMNKWLRNRNVSTLQSSSLPLTSKAYLPFHHPWTILDNALCSEAPDHEEMWKYSWRIVSQHMVPSTVLFNVIEIVGRDWILALKLWALEMTSINWQWNIHTWWENNYVGQWLDSRKVYSKSFGVFYVLCKLSLDSNSHCLSKPVFIEPRKSKIKLGMRQVVLRALFHCDWFSTFVVCCGSQVTHALVKAM